MANDLFGSTQGAREPALLAIDAAHDALPSWYNVVARAKLGRTDGWRWFQLQAVRVRDEYTGDTLVTGAVPVGFVSRGPNAGAPKWPPVAQSERVLVTRAEVEAARVAWERETCRCSECAGTGQRLHAVCMKNGRSYRRCDRCGGGGIR